MEKGIQLNDKLGNVLINIYEPNEDKAREAVALLVFIRSLINEQIPTQAQNVAPAPSYAATQPARRDWSQPKGDQSVKWCTKGHETGAHTEPVRMKWVQFKEPRPSKFNPSKMETGFFSCDACYQAKNAGGQSFQAPTAPTYAAPPAPPMATPATVPTAHPANPAPSYGAQSDTGLAPSPDELTAALEDIPF